MEESKLSENNLLLSINNGISVIEERCQLIEGKIEALEEKLQKIFWFIEFHLGEVPQKYKKFNPERGDYPYFKTKIDFNDKVQIATYGEDWLPKNPEELKESAMKMKYYASKQKAIDEERKKKVNDEMIRLASSEASSETSASQDSPQECKHPESSPSSQESPDHKNPPSQT